MYKTVIGSALFLISAAFLGYSFMGAGADNGSRGGMMGGSGMMGGMMGGSGMMGMMGQYHSWFNGQTLPVDFKTLRPPENEAAIAEGKNIFLNRCAICHGEKGDGQGKGAKDLLVKPRDFTYAVFKFRSTPTGSLPTDEDIFKTVSRGLHGTAMLPRVDLTTQEKWKAVYYVKTLSGFFDGSEPSPVMRPPAPTRPAAWYADKGRGVYEKAKCFECHGNEGYGDGMKMNELKDDWGRRIRPTNFRESILKRGLDVGEIYLSVSTGLNGTPMPSYSMSLSEEEILSVAHYVRSIAKKPEASGMMGMMRNMTRDEGVGMRLIMHGG